MISTSYSLVKLSKYKQPLAGGKKSHDLQIKTIMTLKSCEKVTTSLDDKTEAKY